MSRTLATLIVVLTTSSAFCQGTSEPTYSKPTYKDSVERLTDSIMRRFMPSWTRAEPIENDFESERMVRAEQRSFRQRTQTTPLVDPELDQIDELDVLRVFDKMPMPRGFPSFPLEIERFGAPSFGNFSGATAASSAWTAVPRPNRTLKAAVPAPLSLSRASANGIHAIQAVVPTKDGPRRLELKGTSEQVRRQVEALPHDIRSIMEDALRF